MNKYTKDELTLIFLDSFESFDNDLKQNLFGFFKDKKDYKATVEKEKQSLISLMGEERFSLFYNSLSNDYLEEILDSLSKNGIKAVTVKSENYPNSLKETDLPPLVLYCKGDISLLEGELFGIVGSRKSLPLSVNLCKDYSEELLNAGFVLVTGCAEGIDQTVLETALKVNGKVISVIASGIEKTYPSSNANLVEEVAKNGLVISEYPPKVVAKPFFFPIRNRIIAGLSKGVLIVNGRIKSGVRYTAEYAEIYGKDVFAIPYSVGVKSGEGANEIIKMGGILTDTPQDILAYYGKERKEETALFELSDSDKEIIKVLEEGAKHIDAICSALDKKIYEIMPSLSILEIQGVVARQGVNIYGLSKKTED